MADSPPAVLADMFGRWRAPSAPPQDALAFGPASSSPPPPQAFVWREKLPAHLGRASAQLAGGESLLATSDQRLAAAVARLDHFIAQDKQAGEATYAIPFAQPAGPEAELAHWLEELHPSQEAVHFDAGPPRQAAQKWAEARLEFEDFAEQVQRMLTHYAWVETYVEHDPQPALMGRTQVAWGGDFSTVLLPGLATAQVELHQRNLALAVAHRAALIHTFLLITQSGLKLAKLSALLASGGGIAAVPIAWQFISQVLAEIKRGGEKARKQVIA